jgi:hypothetical protein
MKTWEETPMRTRGPKPKQAETAKPTATRIACMCMFQNCLNRADGKGCGHCAKFYVMGNRPPLVNSRCTCGPCNCSCTVVFPRNKRYTIALESEEERRFGTTKDLGGDDPKHRKFKVVCFVSIL